MLTRPSSYLSSIFAITLINKLIEEVLLYASDVLVLISVMKSGSCMIDLISRMVVISG